MVETINGVTHETSYTYDLDNRVTAVTTDGINKGCTYDANGMRTSRTDGTTTYKYVYNGSSLVQMTVGSNTLYFTSDTVTYNGTTYYYVTNLQGNVTGIVDGSGAAVATYVYDAWGNLISEEPAANTIGHLNPIRYRGYVYDPEVDLYYLQSRYYDPERGRFINADGLVSTGGLLGSNMFAYCNNNSVCYTDYTGHAAIPSKAHCLIDDGYGDSPIVDLTKKLNEYMQDNAQKLQEYYDSNGFLAAAVYFYNNVKDGGALDIKLQDEWKFEEGKTYYYNGKELRYDDPGNINFGYVGAVLFSETILCCGAGFNQISKYGFYFGDITTFYDDPRDNEMIKLGYRVYWEVNG